MLAFLGFVAQYGATGNEASASAACLIPASIDCVHWYSNGVMNCCYTCRRGVCSCKLPVGFYETADVHVQLCCVSVLNYCHLFVLA